MSICPKSLLAKKTQQAKQEKRMKRQNFLTQISVILCLLLGMHSFALGGITPQIEAVYGGRVIAIDVVPLQNSHNISRIFAATESANSVFYGDINHVLPTPFRTNTFRFEVVPDLDANANFGNINGIAGHPASGKLFFAHDRGLFSCAMTAGTITQHLEISAGKLMIRNNTLLAIVGGNQLMAAAMNNAGDITGAKTLLDSGFALPCFLVMAVNPAPEQGQVYLMDKDNGLIIKKTSDNYGNISSATTFTTKNVTNVVQNWQALTFGIAPDGRLFVAGSDNGKKVVYSDDDGASWVLVNPGIGGGAGEITFTGDAANYTVICGSAMSTNKGIDGSWVQIPHPGGTRDSNPNDGPAAADPNNSNVFYLTTDLAIGTTTNAGADIFDICEGLTAVQINDFDMTDAKHVAWTASKSGVRCATGFPNAPVWSQAMFPNGDGAPYNAVAVDRSDTNGLTAYAGNHRIYKTTDGGRNWTICYAPPDEASPTFISSLKVSGALVLAGIYQIQPNLLGGLMISTNGGTDFAYQQLADETAGLNINDILLTTESGQSVAYIAAAHNTNATTGAGHIYRLVIGGASSKITLAPAALGIRKLAMDETGGIYASGMRTNYAPVLFYKPADGTWTALSTNGLPADARPHANPNWRGPLITIGFDSATNPVPITAIGITLYYLPNGAAEWTTSDSMIYPAGTQINTIYWDELMVGTDIGLFSHPTNLDPPEDDLKAVAADFDGDRLPDIAAINGQGTWMLWLSGSGYRFCGAYPLGIIGEPAAGDFDQDNLADPIILDQQARLIVHFSHNRYQPTPIPIGHTGKPVVADFDGDGFADLGIVDQQGKWRIWFSSANYAAPSGPYLFNMHGTPLAADFDGDAKADPLVIDDQGNAKIWLSGNNYAPTPLLSLALTGAVLANDFDGDRLADLLDIRDGGKFFARLSSSGYQSLGPYQLPMPK